MKKRAFPHGPGSDAPDSQSEAGQVEERELPISSYVILGLLALCGPLTPYEMKKQVDSSIGYFWDFPRAQLYVDPERLARLGLAREEREVSGRRRRTYHLTSRGLATLRAWLLELPAHDVEMRDPGLLKLYFGPLLTQHDVIALARRERDLHQRRLAEYEAIQAKLAGDPQAHFGLATLRMGLNYERLSIAYWDDIAAHPPAIEPGVADHSPTLPPSGAAHVDADALPED